MVVETNREIKQADESCTISATAYPLCQWWHTGPKLSSILRLEPKPRRPVLCVHFGGCQSRWMSLLWFCSKKPLYGGKLVRQEKLKISISISCISPFVILVKMSLPFYSTLTSLCDLIPISLVSWPGARRAHSMNPPRHGIRTTLQSPLVNFRIQYIFCAQKLARS